MNSQQESSKGDFITLSCPNCGGKLQITPDIERFTCQYCGYEHIVRRRGGVVSLEPVVHMMGQINQGIGMVGSNVRRLTTNAERQAAEAAINRCKDEITAAKNKIASDIKNKKSMWMLPLYSALGAAGIFILGKANSGLDETLDLFLQIFLWIMIGCIFLTPIAAIGSGTYYKKEIAKQNGIIRQKESELAQNYKILSQGM